MVEAYFLILFVNREAIVLPEKYPKEQCEKIGKDWGRYKCVNAPYYGSSSEGKIITLPNYQFERK